MAQFYCGMSSVTANSRMIYAFSRDGAVPGHRLWHTVSKKRRVPVASAWFGAVGAFLISIPYLWNYTAYNAVVATAVVGLYIAYLTPVFLRRINSKAFVPGPYKLNPTFSFLINWIAIIWVVFICIIFLLPQWSPITVNDLQLLACRGGGRHRLRRHLLVGRALASGSRARRSRVPPRSSPRSSASSPSST